jgi:hypothetical protein
LAELEQPAKKARRELAASRIYVRTFMSLLSDFNSTPPVRGARS